MKTSKKINCLLSLCLVVCLLLSTLSFSFISASAYDATTITYDFANNNAGFAEGTISLHVPFSDDYGTYELFWADNEKALDGYYPIASMDVSGESESYTFAENTAIPPDATRVIAVQSLNPTPSEGISNDSIAAEFELPSNKINSYSSTDKTLSFLALSDTQLDLQSAVFYDYCEEHFEQALECAAQRDVDFVTMSGDCINDYESGTSKEWQAHQKIIADSPFTKPIYETNGNHSMKNDVAYGIEAYKNATGLNVDKEAIGDKPYYEMTAENGDHFIFVAMEGNCDVVGYDQFSTEQLDWLESTIAKYYNDGHHIYVFEHAFFNGFGPGDDKEKQYYGSGLLTTDDYPGNQRFLKILNKYNEVFVYSGHSHLDFMYNWNYDNENGLGANMFHIPATANTSHIVDEKIDYTMSEHDSQCYIVESYSGAVITYGMNIPDDLIYPQYTYIVNTADYAHVPATEPPTEYIPPETESSAMIDVQVENATTYLYKDGSRLYFYNNDSGNYFEVDSLTGIASIPENATNLTLYRCKAAFNSGAEEKSDDVTSYWNKFGPCRRLNGQVVFYVASSSNFSWKDGSIVYPPTQPPTGIEPTEPPTESSPDQPKPPLEPTEVPSEVPTIEITVLDSTPTTWVYSAGAALFLYDRDTAKHYDLVGGKATVPKSATNFNLYRCSGAWGQGNVGDGITAYWNKWTLTQRGDAFDIVNLTDDGKFGWLSSQTYQPEPDSDFYLVGSFDSQDYNGKDYKFDESGNLSMTFYGDSYAYVVSSANNAYWTNGWLGNSVSTATLYRAASLSDPNKLFIPAGKVTLTLVTNDDGTLTLSYTNDPIVFDRTQIEIIPQNIDVGDVDGDGNISIIDATLIQKHLASVRILDSREYYAADLFGDGTVNIIGATLIQKRLAKLTGLFPAEDGYVPDVSTLERLMSTTASVLYTEYRFASYTAYTSLKAQYYLYMNADISSLSDDDYADIYNSVKKAYDIFLEMKKNNNIVTVYFCNDIGWTTVKAYCSNSQTGKGINTLETAQTISKINLLDCGARIFCITVNRDKYDKIVFLDGLGARTAELDIPTKNYLGYYTADSELDKDGNIVPSLFRYTYDRIALNK